MSERTFRLYDTMTKKVKPLELSEPGHLRFYSCGPTVYSYAHIGNFRTFLTADLIVRTAKALGWRVTYVSNITDVGHLTQDDVADAEGEDKMAKALLSKEGEPFHNVWELAEYYEDAFKEDWRRLNLLPPTVQPRATQHMREQILAARQLVASGNAYETPTGVYFDVDSFARYGGLSGNTQENLIAASRSVVVDENKRRQADFALWKKDEKHLMQWYSPFDWGFPGWHLECSVMAMKYLGETIDLHGGGEDLIFPHHECEIAQSESLTGKPFCRHWVHTRFLLVNGQKMSKSQGNFYTVRDLLEQGVDPLALRYALISVPYLKNLNFTIQGLRDADANVERFRRATDTVASGIASERAGEDVLGALLEDIYAQSLDALCNDLNTSVALAKAIEGARAITKEGENISRASAEAGQKFLNRIHDLLGVVKVDGGSAPITEPPASIDKDRIEALIAERAEAKRAKDFARADSIRKQLDDDGIELRDSPEGTRWLVKERLV